MLPKTFIHLPHIGERRERLLWRAGITSWYGLLERAEMLPLSQSQRAELKVSTRRSIEALELKDATYFAHSLPSCEHWRGYNQFKKDALFLDIETTGLSPSTSTITVVGIFDGTHVYQFVHGDDLDGLYDLLDGCKLLLTFNGRRFDVPFMLEKMPDLRVECMHADLLHLTRRLGIRGGLKSVEVQLGLARPEHVRGLTGYDAVRLWREHERGVDGALETLLEYNAQDIVNLKTIMDVLHELACLRLMR